jgi:hypothetical protein
MKNCMEKETNTKLHSVVVGVRSQGSYQIRVDYPLFQQPAQHSLRRSGGTSLRLAEHYRGNAGSGRADAVAIGSGPP